MILRPFWPPYTVGTLTIRIGFGVFYTMIVITSPQNPIMIVKAPTLPSALQPELEPQGSVLLLSFASGSLQVCRGRCTACVQLIAARDYIDLAQTHSYHSISANNIVNSNNTILNLYSYYEHLYNMHDRYYRNSQSSTYLKFQLPEAPWLLQETVSSPQSSQTCLRYFPQTLSYKPTTSEP